MICVSEGGVHEAIPTMCYIAGHELSGGTAPGAP